MSIIVAIDETASQQNTDQGGVTANDIGTGLPSLFSDALLAATNATRMGAAVSGYTGGVGTGSPALTFGTNVQDVFFASNDKGDAVDGVDSGLKTLDGTTIKLYTSPLNNNVVLGRAGSASGDLVFALYLDTVNGNTSVNTSGGGDVGATGAKLWVAQYQPIQHFNDVAGTPFDESVVQLLSNKLYVGVNSLVNFDLKDAPSGQSVFMTVGDGSPATGESAIVITGLLPSDTVNTSKAGNQPIVVGTNNQSTVPGNGLWISYVTLGDPDGNGPLLPDSEFTVPNLSSPEASVAANIRFNAYQANTGGGFTVVQTNPSGSSTELRLAAFNNTDATEKGITYKDGLGDGDDEPANVTSVTITRGGKAYTASDTTGGLFINDNGTPSTSDDTILQNVTKVKGNNVFTNVTVDFSGSTASIVGLQAHDHVDYVADSHNRILITNSAPSNGPSFDLGDFSSRSGSLTAPALGDVAFLDDEPTASIVRTANVETLDETLGAKAGDTNAALDDISASNTDPFAATYGTPIGALTGVDLVDTTTTSGADSVGASTAVTLAITNGNGTDSGLKTTNGTQIDLWLETNGTVTGRTGGASGTVVFAIKIAGDGKVDVAQYAALKHPTSPSNYDELVDLTGKLNAVVRSTDGDSDVATNSVDIGAAIRFEDDGPALAFGNVIGTGTLDPQYGYWNMSAGVDGLATNATVSLDRLNITLDTFQLVRPDTSVFNGTSATFDETAPSPDGNGAYHWTGELLGDFDNNSATADTKEHFYLTAFNDGTYAIDLVEAFGSKITTSTKNGSLSAGGPDPSQTLTLEGGVDKVVFFAVDPTVNPTDVIPAIGSGEPDLTEPTLQQKSSMADYDEISSNGKQHGDNTFTFINDTYNMNVSTAGIGVNNNVLEGNKTVGIQADDESFVINPLGLKTEVKVYIDNSNGGYTTSSEDLYYRAYYSDGTVGNLTEVNTLTPESGGEVSFTVLKDGSKLIDAVQLVMGRGAIKIPTIEFSSETNELSTGIKLSFTASIADGDGDTISKSFVTNLADNKLSGGFDYVLEGINNKADAFDVALASALNRYQINGFELGSDKLVLLGAGANNHSFDYDTSPNGTVVNIAEPPQPLLPNGQITSVTVVGVHITDADIATFI